jgi:hypothetical protein
VKKQPRQHDAKHLQFVRGLPCCVCGDNTSTEAAHIRMADPMIAKPSPGTGTKAHDKFTVPLCGKCHREQHTRSEGIWWAITGLDPIKIALALYSVSGDHEQGERIALRQHR